MLLKSHHFNAFSSKLILFSTFFCFFVSLFVNELALNLIILSGILSFGVIHGGNDLLLLKKSSSRYISKIKLFFTYLIMVFLCGTFFFMFPATALVFFVLYSSYHFGEQQWTLFEKNNNNDNKIYLLYFTYGLFLFSILFWTNNSLVSEIIYDITGFFISKSFLYYLMLFSLFSLIIAVLLNFKSILNQVIIQLVLLFILVMFFFNSSLIWAFGVYFVFWHSIPSILEQSNFLFGSSNLGSIMKYLRYAFLYWVLSLIGLCILYYLFREYQNLLISILFSFLAAITLPHTIVIHKIKGN